MELPIVDYNDIVTSNILCQKLQKFGFCMLANHPLIKSGLLEEYYSLYGIFFRSKDKNNFYFDANMHDGFIPIDHSETAKNSKKKDYKEFFHYYPWGRCPSALSTISSRMFFELQQLAQRVTSIIELNLPEHIANKNNLPLTNITIGSSRTLLRTSFYPKFSQEAYDMQLPRAHEHTDINLLTIQPPANISGLECKINNDWQRVESSDLIFIGCGEMLTKYSFGYYPACEHRVNEPSDEENVNRISTMMFLHPRSDIILENDKASNYLATRVQELGLDR